MALNELSSGLRFLSSLTPTAISQNSLVHRYSVDSLTATDGDSITTWPDSEGGADLELRDGDPTYVEDGPNGNAAVYFNNGDVLDVDFTTIDQPNTIFVVYQREGAGTSREYVYDGGPNAGDPSARHLYALNQSGVRSIWSGSFVDDDSFDTFIPHLGRFKYDGASSTGRIDSSQVLSGDTDTQSLRGFTVGDSSAASGSADASNVWVSDILIYDTDQTVEERDDTEQALGKKYNITLSPVFEQQSELTDLGAHQGVAADGTYVFTSSSQSDDTAGSGGKALRKWDKNGNLIEERSNPETDGTDMTQVSDISIINGNLYGTSNNFSDTRDDGYVKIWDKSDLSFIEEHQVAGDVAEGVSQRDGDFWVVYNDAERVDRYDDTWTKTNDYQLTYSVGTDWGYQCIEWVGDYIYCNMHEGGDSPETCDVYRWTGSEFVKYTRLDPPTNGSHQGIAKEPGENTMWFAERNTGTNTHDVIKSTFKNADGKPNGT